MNTVPGTLERYLYKAVKWADEYGQAHWNRKNATVEDAEVVSSELKHGRVHAPVLDIDVPAFLIPSTTPGHSHLYIDVPMSWRHYKRLLKQMEKCGILESGYVNASIRRKHTAVRLPWVKKEIPYDSI